jgi:hypothetical protein
MFKSLHKDLEDLNNSFKELVEEIVVSFVVVILLLIGLLANIIVVTSNAIKQCNDFNEELDAKMAQIEVQTERIINK